MTQPNKDKPDNIKVWTIDALRIDIEQLFNKYGSVKDFNKTFISKEDFVRVLDDISKEFLYSSCGQYYSADMVIAKYKQQITKKACTEPVEGEGEKDE